MRFKNHEFPPENCTGLAEWEDGGSNDLLMENYIE